MDSVIVEPDIMLNRRLVDGLRAHTTLWQALSRLDTLELPNWYLGAGCVTQSIWNLECGYPVRHGIRDYDLVYFDSDLSDRAEQQVRAEASALLGDLGIALDVKNQARVHTWYRSRFGYDIQPYASIHDAIATWPATAGAVAVRFDREAVEVYAPFGLQDLFDLVVRANRVQITRTIYEEKVRRWSSYWPQLRVLPWEQGVGLEGARIAGSSA